MQSRHASEFIKSYAFFNDDHTRRYSLYRQWDKSKHEVAFIGLNPSQADDKVEDPTICKCIQYAMDWGYGGIIMFNLFSLIMTDSQAMLRHLYPNDNCNDNTLLGFKSFSKIDVVACWGAKGSHLSRDLFVMKMFPKLYYIELCKDGMPKHPLYLRKDLKVKLWVR